jgi:broad specificity phosphatase PhoE
MSTGRPSRARGDAKTVLCIRHGESTFNAAWRAAPHDPLHFDARLSASGHEQVRRARTAVLHYPVELVITSPLTRALQTTVGLFGDHPSGPRVEVSALLRERVENSCDLGRSPAELAAEFPSLDFARLDGVWWHAEGTPDHRGVCIEPVPLVQARVAAFRDYVSSRPESIVAVVGHGTFLFYLTDRVFGNCGVAELLLD